MENIICPCDAFQDVFITGQVSPDYLYAAVDIGFHDLPIFLGWQDQSSDLKTILPLQQFLHAMLSHISGSAGEEDAFLTVTHICHPF